MMNDNQRGDNRPDDQPNEGTDVSRREAIGRFAQYTAPVMLALLTSEQTASASAFCLECIVSDIRLKHQIKQVGRLPNGLGLYRYQYLWSDTPYVGVMAQEVEAVVPDAVVRAADGYLRVDYVRLGLSLQTWDDWVAASYDSARPRPGGHAPN
jgi:endosialidase-like protein